MSTKVLIITPPFTQLNTPYPASAYLKGFLNTRGIPSVQADLGIEVILSIFSKTGLTSLFETIEQKELQLSDNALRICSLKRVYIQKIDAVISFLQGKSPTFAHLMSQEHYFPQASRFGQLADLDWAFGVMGNQDKAKHLATLFLEDISDLIVETVDENFGFSRYAERLGMSAATFDELYGKLNEEYSYVDELLLAMLKDRLYSTLPELVAFSVPFPGNLYAAFRSAQFIKKHFPKVKVAMGGGFPNTELRSLSDPRVFEFFDFITLDDGEAPVEHLIQLIDGKRKVNQLKRTFTLVDNKVEYINASSDKDYKQNDVGTPDYSDLLLDKYISVIEVVNPMHRMWSDGRWNKLTMAHGCYWGKCTFCDISLDYIKVYEPVLAKQLVFRMEQMILQTGETGFHFVDEAAPPALMRELALEILKRGLSVTWWTNIRFEKKFTKDLCLLLKASGCIAVSGGLEVASDRLLELIDKGVSVEQVAHVTRNFTDAGIMTHAYLMYGYPTQTIQETIDSLEMVRQLFEAGVIQSGFWHQFALTAHSPIGLNPAKYGVIKDTEVIGTFANNDILFTDETGIDHEIFSFGLKKSLYNFMHGIGFELPVNQWFETKMPKTTMHRDYISNCLNHEEFTFDAPSAKVVWLGAIPQLRSFEKMKKNQPILRSELTFFALEDTFTLQMSLPQGIWLKTLLELLSSTNSKPMTLKEVEALYSNMNTDDFEPFWYGKTMGTLKELGLLVV